MIRALRISLTLVTLGALLVGCQRSASEPVGSAATPTDAKPLVVEVYSDVVCPFCFIGTERLDRAIASSGLEGRVEVRHRTYLLNPDVPDEGINVREYLRARTGREPSFGPVEAMARESGIPLDLSKQERSYSTVAAHVLLRHAEKKGTQRALEQALYRAHFLEAANVSDVEVLVRVASAHGFTADEVRRLASDPTERAAVRREADEATRRGVRGVPYFVFPDGSVLHGAQSEVKMQAALESAANAS